MPLALLPSNYEISSAYLGPDPWLLPTHMLGHQLDYPLIDLHDTRHPCGWLTFVYLWTYFQLYQPLFITYNWAYLFPLPLPHGHPSTHPFCFTADGTSELFVIYVFNPGSSYLAIGCHLLYDVGV